MVTTESTLNGILSAWGMDNNPVPAASPQDIEAATPTCQADSRPETAPDSTERKDDALAEGFAARIGRLLLGNVCSDAACDARRIVELCRNHPIRPYLVEGGGRGFTIPNGWSKGEGHWEAVKEFERLWWSKAGDMVVEYYGDRLPMARRNPWEKSGAAGEDCGGV